MDAATIEEANKLRVKMGMKPLPVPGAAPADLPSNDNRSKHESDGEPESNLETREAAASDNFREIQKIEAEKRARAERLAALKKQIEKEQREKKLEGMGLGDETSVDVNAKAWLMGQKKRQKKIEKARKLEEEQAEAEAQAAAALEYTSKDLAGMKVAHDMAQLGDMGEQILTLKDASIDQLEEEGDELENIDLRDAEKLKERLELKKGIRNYNPLDDDTEVNLLAKYDEEIYGKKSQKFTLDTNGAVAALENLLEGEASELKPQENSNFDIDMIDGNGQPSTDYLDVSEIKVKKPKKNKKSKSKQKGDDDSLFPVDIEQMEVDPVPAKKRKTTTDDLDDDDDLQAALSKQRREILKKRKKMKPEDIAKQLKTENEEEQLSEPTGLVIGEVSEFVSSIGVEEDEVKKPKKKTLPPSPPAQDTDGDANMNDAEPETFREYDLNLVNPADGEEEEDALLNEKTIGGGMADALSILRERNLIKDTESAEKHAKNLKKEEFLRRKALIEAEHRAQAAAQREKERKSGRFKNMSSRESDEYKQQQNAQRELQFQRKLDQLYKEYQPTFEIRHVDDEGHELDEKEAFKDLSHTFHGKGSGQGKTELKAKKHAQEKRREAQPIFDASQNVGLGSATAHQSKKRKEAGVRLG